MWDVSVTIINAEKLTNKSITGKQDTFFHIKCQGQAVRSSTKKDVTDAARWDEAVKDGLYGIYEASIITFELYDARLMLRDRLMGEATIAMERIKKLGPGHVHQLPLTKHGNTADIRGYINVSFATAESDASAAPAMGGKLHIGRRPDKGMWLFGETEPLASKYTLGEKLGEGAFGITKVAVCKKDGKEYACKTIPKNRLTSQVAIEDVRREIEVMHHVAGHNNVVNMHEMLEDGQAVHIIMELCRGGNLYDYITKSEGYTEKDVAWIMQGVMAAVQHCHAMNVFHRDLKPENFLLMERATTGSKPLIKVTDFGLSTFMRKEERFEDVLGTCYYMAPEVLLRSSSRAADVWSCGVIMYILLCGEPPFNGSKETKIFRAIVEDEPDYSASAWKLVSPAGRALLRRMLKKDDAKRPTAAEVLQDVWFTGQGAWQKPLEPEVLRRLKHFGNANKLKKAALLYLSRNMPAVERAGLEAMFADMDEDRSETLSGKELQEAIRRRGGSILTDQVSDLVRKLDLDQDGTVSKDEFVAAAVQLQNIPSMRIRDAFRHFDQDDNQYITKEELKIALSETSSAEVDEILRQVDTDKDGRINYHEFRTLMTHVSIEKGKKLLTPVTE